MSSPPLPPPRTQPPPAPKEGGSKKSPRNYSATQSFLRSTAAAAVSPAHDFADLNIPGVPTLSSKMMRGPSSRASVSSQGSGTISARSVPGGKTGTYRGQQQQQQQAPADAAASSATSGRVTPPPNTEPGPTGTPPAGDKSGILPEALRRTRSARDGALIIHKITPGKGATKVEEHRSKVKWTREPEKKLDEAEEEKLIEEEAAEILEEQRISSQVVRDWKVDDTHPRTSAVQSTDEMLSLMATAKSMNSILSGFNTEQTFRTAQSYGSMHSMSPTMPASGSPTVMYQPPDPRLTANRSPVMGYQQPSLPRQMTPPHLNPREVLAPYMGTSSGTISPRGVGGASAHQFDRVASTSSIRSDVRTGVNFGDPNRTLSPSVEALHGSVTMTPFDISMNSSGDRVALSPVRPVSSNRSESAQESPIQWRYSQQDLPPPTIPISPPTPAANLSAEQRARLQTQLLSMDESIAAAKIELDEEARTAARTPIAPPALLHPEQSSLGKLELAERSKRRVFVDLQRTERAILYYQMREHVKRLVDWTQSGGSPGPLGRDPTRARSPQGLPPMSPPLPTIPTPSGVLSPTLASMQASTSSARASAANASALNQRYVKQMSMVTTTSTTLAEANARESSFRSESAQRSLLQQSQSQSQQISSSTVSETAAKTAAAATTQPPTTSATPSTRTGEVEQRFAAIEQWKKDVALPSSAAAAGSSASSAVAAATTTASSATSTSAAGTTASAGATTTTPRSPTVLSSGGASSSGAPAPPPPPPQVPPIPKLPAAGISSTTSPRLASPHHLAAAVANAAASITQVSSVDTSRTVSSTHSSSRSTITSTSTAQRTTATSARNETVSRISNIQREVLQCIQSQEERQRKFMLELESGEWSWLLETATKASRSLFGTVSIPRASATAAASSSSSSSSTSTAESKTSGGAAAAGLAGLSGSEMEGVAAAADAIMAQLAQMSAACTASILGGVASATGGTSTTTTTTTTNPVQVNIRPGGSSAAPSGSPTSTTLPAGASAMTSLVVPPIGTTSRSSSSTTLEIGLSFDTQIRHSSSREEVTTTTLDKESAAATMAQIKSSEGVEESSATTTTTTSEETRQHVQETKEETQTQTQTRTSSSTGMDNVVSQQLAPEKRTGMDSGRSGATVTTRSTVSSGREVRESLRTVDGKVVEDERSENAYCNESHEGGDEDTESEGTVYYAGLPPRNRSELAPANSAARSNFYANAFKFLMEDEEHYRAVIVDSENVQWRTLSQFLMRSQSQARRYSRSSLGSTSSFSATTFTATRTAASTSARAFSAAEVDSTSEEFFLRTQRIVVMEESEHRDSVVQQEKIAREAIALLAHHSTSEQEKWASTSPRTPRMTRAGSMSAESQQWRERELLKKAERELMAETQERQRELSSVLEVKWHRIENDESWTRGIIEDEQQEELSRLLFLTPVGLSSHSTSSTQVITSSTSSSSSTSQQINGQVITEKRSMQMFTSSSEPMETMTTSTITTTSTLPRARDLALIMTILRAEQAHRSAVVNAEDEARFIIEQIWGATLRHAVRMNLESAISLVTLTEWIWRADVVDRESEVFNAILQKADWINSGDRLLCWAQDELAWTVHCRNLLRRQIELPQYKPRTPRQTTGPSDPHQPPRPDGQSALSGLEMLLLQEKNQRSTLMLQENLAWWEVTVAVDFFGKQTYDAYDTARTSGSITSLVSPDGSFRTINEISMKSLLAPSGPASAAPYPPPPVLAVLPASGSCELTPRTQEQLSKAAHKDRSPALSPDYKHSPRHAQLQSPVNVPRLALNTLAAYREEEETASGAVATAVSQLTTATSSSTTITSSSASSTANLAVGSQSSLRPPSRGNPEDDVVSEMSTSASSSPHLSSRNSPKGDITPSGTVVVAPTSSGSALQLLQGRFSQLTSAAVSAVANRIIGTGANVTTTTTITSSSSSNPIVEQTIQRALAVERTISPQKVVLSNSNATTRSSSNQLVVGENVASSLMVQNIPPSVSNSSMSSSTTAVRNASPDIQESTTSFRKGVSTVTTSVTTTVVPTVVTKTQESTSITRMASMTRNQQTSVNQQISSSEIVSSGARAIAQRSEVIIKEIDHQATLHQQQQAALITAEVVDRGAIWAEAMESYSSLRIEQIRGRQAIEQKFAIYGVLREALVSLIPEEAFGRTRIIESESESWSQLLMSFTAHHTHVIMLIAERARAEQTIRERIEVETRQREIELASKWEKQRAEAERLQLEWQRQQTEQLDRQRNEWLQMIRIEQEKMDREREKVAQQLAAATAAASASATVTPPSTSSRHTSVSAPTTPSFAEAGTQVIADITPRLEPLAVSQVHKSESVQRVFTQAIPTPVPVPAIIAPRPVVPETTMTTPTRSTSIIRKIESFRQQIVSENIAKTTVTSTTATTTSPEAALSSRSAPSTSVSRGLIPSPHLTPRRKLHRSPVSGRQASSMTSSTSPSRRSESSAAPRKPKSMTPEPPVLYAPQPSAIAQSRAILSSVTARSRSPVAGSIGVPQPPPQLAPAPQPTASEVQRSPTPKRAHTPTRTTAFTRISRIVPPKVSTSALAVSQIISPEKPRAKRATTPPAGVRMAELYRPKIHSAFTKPKPSAPKQPVPPVVKTPPRHDPEVDISNYLVFQWEKEETYHRQKDLLEQEQLERSFILANMQREFPIAAALSAICETEPTEPAHPERVTTPRSHHRPASTAKAPSAPVTPSRIVTGSAALMRTPTTVAATPEERPGRSRTVCMVSCGTHFCCGHEEESKQALRAHRAEARKTKEDTLSAKHRAIQAEVKTMKEAERRAAATATPSVTTTSNVTTTERRQTNTLTQRQTSTEVKAPIHKVTISPGPSPQRPISPNPFQQQQQSYNWNSAAASVTSTASSHLIAPSTITTYSYLVPATPPPPPPITTTTYTYVAPPTPIETTTTIETLDVRRSHSPAAPVMMYSPASASAPIYTYSCVGNEAAVVVGPAAYEFAHRSVSPVSYSPMGSRTRSPAVVLRSHSASNRSASPPSGTVYSYPADLSYLAASYSRSGAVSPAFRSQSPSYVVTTPPTITTTTVLSETRRSHSPYVTVSSGAGLVASSSGTSIASVERALTFSPAPASTASHHATTTTSGSGTGTVPPTPSTPAPPPIPANALTPVPPPSLFPNRSTTPVGGMPASSSASHVKESGSTFSTTFTDPRAANTYATMISRPTTTNSSTWVSSSSSTSTTKQSTTFTSNTLNTPSATSTSFMSSTSCDHVSDFSSDNESNCSHHHICQCPCHADQSVIRLSAPSVMVTTSSSGPIINPVHTATTTTTTTASMVSDDSLDAVAQIPLVGIDL